MIYFRHMKQGGDRKKASGFTIVETLIVLAVTGSLFILVALLINGRQNKTAFYTAINGLQQQVQQVINETSSGYFPNNKFNCTASGASDVIIRPGSNTQGTNGDCLFVGKVLQFGTVSDHSQLVVYPLAGRKEVAGAANTTILATNPVAIYPNSSGTKSQVDATATLIMQSNLEVATDGTGKLQMFYDGVNQTGAVGFFSGNSSGSFASLGTGGLSSGAQQLSLYAVKTTTPNITPTNMADDIDSTTNLVNASEVTICIASSTTNQSGLITISESLAVTLQIKAGKLC